MDIKDKSQNESQNDKKVMNVPQTLKQVLDVLNALSNNTSGGRGYQRYRQLEYLMNAHDANPAIFKEHQIQEALVKALGAKFADLADYAEKCLKENGSEITPLLMDGFHPKGKKEMLRRLNIIETVAGGEANEFYVANLGKAKESKNSFISAVRNAAKPGKAENELRQALIFALRHHQDNTELLIELSKNEKGNAKKVAYMALSYMKSDMAADFFEELYKKEPQTVMEAIYLSDVLWASKLAARCLKSQMEKWKEASEKGQKVVLDRKAEELLKSILYALVGKNGKEVYEVLKEAAGFDEKYKLISEQNNREYAGYIRTNFITLEERCDGDGFRFEDVPTFMKQEDLLNFKALISHILKLNLIINPDEMLKTLAFELQEDNTFLGTAIIAELLYDERFCEWINHKLENVGFIKLLVSKNGNQTLSAVPDNVLFNVHTRDKIKKQVYEIIERELIHLVYDEHVRQYVLKFELLNSNMQWCNRQWCSYSQPVAVDVKGELTDFMMDGFRVFAPVLEQCIDQQDLAYQKRLEEYFYQCALESTEFECERYWRALKKCGCARCDGLLVRAVSTRNDIEVSLNLLFDALPGTKEAKVQEANQLLELIRSNQIKVKDFDEEAFQKHIQEMVLSL